MTTTYDPDHPAYFDEADMREELGRVYDLCHGCRLCLSLCPSFPTMFNLIDAKDGDVAALTPSEQDQVVDECYQCKLCYVKCPYIPPHEWQLDFPRLMQRAGAARPKTIRERLTTQALARTDQTGKIASLTAPLTNRALGHPGSAVRKVMDKAVGIAADRVLPPYARTRFTTWFKKRRQRELSKPQQGSVAVFPTCLVEYQNPSVGQDLVSVYERNGVRCDVPDGISCCGAPWLHSAEFDKFRKQATRNVRILADVVRSGKDIVVPQPTCGYVLKRDYPEYLDDDDARLVGANTYDASEYLWRLHKSSGLDTDFHGDVPATIAYHAPCHLQAQNIGLRSRDLIKLTGAKVTTIMKCSGIDGTWGLRSENYELARKVAQPLRDALVEADAEVVCGDCQLANGAIVQETGAVPLHPLQVLARAYGIS
jgi:glycerol-3-phosphate dehydrogenase subunit C